MFRHRQQLRRWAARVLFIWLFGVGVGIAHACLTPSLVQPGDAVTSRAAGEGMAQHGAVVVEIAQHHGSCEVPPGESLQGQDGAAAKSNCEDFCDKAGASIPSLKAALDDVLLLALPAAAVAIVSPMPALVPMPLRVPHRDGIWAPLIHIAFLRLAL